MPDLIAQGSEPEHRWRRKVVASAPQVIGRGTGPWSIPWDERISRRHVEVEWKNGRLHVTVLPDARNPVFHRGRKSGNFELKPGDHFVIGGTTFTLVDEQVNVSLDVPQPANERTFNAEELRHKPYRQADQRIEVLSRLPDIISGSATDNEMFVRLVNLLLSGIPRSTAAAIVAVEESGSVKVLHWDRRILSGTEFRPSERLIRQAVTSGESTAHVWGGKGPSMEADVTMSEGVDWAFCTPVIGSACKGWSLYVTGSFAGENPLEAVSDPEILRDDVKFTELTAATLAGLSELRLLARRQAGLGQFFSPLVMDALAGQDPNVALAPREADVSVLFCDLRGFSRHSERHSGSLTELLERVSQSLGVMTQHILAEGGVIGDFHGDSAMGFWGWPLPQPDAAARACRAALAIRQEFADTACSPTATTTQNPLSNFRVGIGIASGRAVAGKIGTTDQVKVTVFGPVVNLASRLETMTKQIHAPILLDEATAAAVRQQLAPDSARLRRVAKVKPAGLDKPTLVSELIPPIALCPGLSDENLTVYEEAVDAFLSGDWARALKLLHRVPPDDLVKDFLTVFIAQHNRTPPTGWDGTIPLSTK
jgi:adenylate cyclase